jgi:hypothetical protein
MTAIVTTLEARSTDREPRLINTDRMNVQFGHKSGGCGGLRYGLAEANPK